MPERSGHSVSASTGGVGLCPSLRALIQSLCRLPGVGPKSAQRIAFHMLQRNRHGASDLAQQITRVMEVVGHCQMCQMFSESSVCPLCADTTRAPTLCVVGAPADVWAIEQMGTYRGRYFVLMGYLSPLDGLGPEALGLPHLLAQAQRDPWQEVILATSPTVEGEATAYYIAEMFKPLDIPITRIAHGVPMGGELEYLDGGTLAHAFAGRASF